MADNSHDSNHHGHSVAIWTAVGIILVASFLMCLAVVLGSWLMFGGGALLTVIGTATGVALSRAGYGAAKILPPGQMPASAQSSGDAPEGTPSVGIS